MKRYIVVFFHKHSMKTESIYVEAYNAIQAEEKAAEQIPNVMEWSMNDYCCLDD